MILGLVVAVAVLLRWLRGASIVDLAEFRLRGEGLMFAALVSVVALPPIGAMLHPDREIVVPIWLLLMALLGALCLANSTLRGLVTMAVGVGLNMLVIAANGAMPVSENAAMAVGGAAGRAAVQNGDFFHSAATAATRIGILADIVPVPGFQGLRCVLSVGDILMYAGVLIALVAFSPQSRRSPVASAS